MFYALFDIFYSYVFTSVRFNGVLLPKFILYVSCCAVFLRHFSTLVVNNNNNKVTVSSITSSLLNLLKVLVSMRKLML